MERVLHILTGPTAVGKTELALRWAEENDAEIVSCDSLLFYRGLDIGTAKPSQEELARVPHHLIDIREVHEPMDVTCYVALARAAVAEIVRRGRRVLVTGGSGFYLKSFLAPVADEVDVGPEIRREVQGHFEREGREGLVRRLLELNPTGLGSLDTANPRRLTRALERCLASGRTLKELAEAFARQPDAFAEFEKRVVRLSREPAELRRRIEARVDAMLQAGLIEEVDRATRAGLEQNPSASRAIGYRETLAHLRGELSREQLRDTIVQDTQALVKKQRTWFRTQLPLHREIDAATATSARLF